MNRVEVSGVVVNRDADEPRRVGGSWQSNLIMRTQEVGWDRSTSTSCIDEHFLAVEFWIESDLFDETQLPRRGDHVLALGSLGQVVGKDGKKHTRIMALRLEIIRRYRPPVRPAEATSGEPPF
jgi:hypothetical protein